MARLAWTVLCILLLTAVSLAQTQAVRVSKDAVSELVNKIRESTDPGAEALTESLAAHEPRFIFIPGVFGSKIWAVDENNVKTHEIWNGELFSPQSLTLTTEQVETSTLNAMNAGLDVDIYGESLSRLSSQSIDAKLFTTFSYDWRRDLVENAAAFQIWLCDNRPTFDGHPTYIIAHSMGGLLVKYWQKEVRSLSCGTSHWLDVQEVIMLGVPLYGAPVALASFAGGVDLTKGVAFGFVSPFDASSRSLTEYGATFPSAYQLLPIYRQGCFPGHKSTRPALYLRSADGGTTPIDNIFDVETWRSLGWPKTLPADLDPAVYYSSMLPEFLANARRFLCELATFDLNSQVKTTYFYGLLSDLSTTSALEVRKANGATVVARECRAAANSCLEEGDGTVPLIIASNKLAGADRAVTRYTANAHQELLKSPILADYVRQIMDDQTLVGLFNAAGVGTESHILIAAAAVDAKVLLPMTLHGRGTFAAEAVAVNRFTLDSLNVTANDISIYANASVTAGEVRGWADIMKILPDADPKDIFDNFNRAGMLAAGMGDWQFALENYDSALRESANLPEGIAKDAVPLIFLQQGSVFEKLGDDDAAIAKYTSAGELGGFEYKPSFDRPSLFFK